MVGKFTAHQNLALQFFTVVFKDPHLHLAVVHQQKIAGFDVTEKLRTSDMKTFMGTQYLFLADGDGLALFIRFLAVGEITQPDLRPFGIQQDADIEAVFLVDFSYQFDVLAMAFMIAMGKVQSGDIHACFGHFQNGIVIVAGRAYRADYLGLFVYHFYTSLSNKR